MSISLILLVIFVIASIIACLLCSYIDKGSIAGLYPQDAYVITVVCFALVMVGIAFGISQ